MALESPEVDKTENGTRAAAKVACYLGTLNTYLGITFVLGIYRM